MPRAMSRVIPAAASPRRATNVTLPDALLQEARAMGVNLSQACERGLAAAVAATRRQRWLEENGEALASSNDYVERHGLPLSGFRLF